jgi:hypothetical protein
MLIRKPDSSYILHRLGCLVVVLEDSCLTRMDGARGSERVRSIAEICLGWSLSRLDERWE